CASLDRFEQAAHRALVGDFERYRDRSLKIGDEAGEDHLRRAAPVTGKKGRAGGRGPDAARGEVGVGHRQRPIHDLSPLPHSTSNWGVSELPSACFIASLLTDSP